MKKQLRGRQRLLPLFYSLSLMLCVNLGWGQQVIGSFPSMDGGFESQAANPATLSGISSEQTAWTAQATSGVGVLSSTGGRSGPKFITYTQTGTTHRRLQSPTADMAAGAYRVQFWYQGDLDGTTNTTTDNLRGGGSSNGTTGATYNSYIKVNNTNAVTPTWTLYEGTFTTTAYSANIGLGAVSVNNTAQFKIDDFAIYPGGTADGVRPPDPTNAQIASAAATQQTISWSAPTDVTDVSGYMVVRSTADPATAPNTKGIYAVGNFVAGTEKVVYLGKVGTNSFVDNGLTQETTYYYRIYTVDKAFNYCLTPQTLSGTTTAPSYDTEPTTAASNISITNASQTSLNISWTAGNGANSVVVVKAGSAVDDVPADGGTYAANTVFTSGSQIGTGNYVVYNGTDNSVTISGLIKRTRYYVKVYTFNGSGGSENYYVTNTPSQNAYTLPGEFTSNGTGGGNWSTAATWANNAVPGQYDNVTIAASDVITFTTAARCYNLTIPATAKVWATSSNTLGIYGTSLSCNGTLGDASNTASILTLEFGGNLTISGSGGIYPFKLRPITLLSDIGVTFDADVSVTGTGTTVMFDNVGNDNVYYTVNSPRTLNITTNFNTASSSATQSTSNNTLTINNGATVNVLGVFNTNEAAGKTYTANINGTLVVTGTSTLFGITGGGVPTFNVNGTYISTGNFNVTSSTATVAPVINVGNAGIITVNGTADFSSTTLSGYIGNAVSTTGGTFNLGSGGTIKFAAANGLESVSGPIRTTTRNFNTEASYHFVGTAAQVPGTDFPARVNNLTVDNAAGVTLDSSKTVNGILNLTAGTLITGANTLTLGGTPTVTAGNIDASNSGATVSFTNTAAVVLPASLFTGNVQNLTINGAGGVTLGSATALAGILTVTSGTLTTGGFLTLKSTECCTATVAEVLGSISGNVRAERYIPVGQRAYRLLSSPVTTTTFIDTNWQAGTHITGPLGATNGFDPTTSNNSSMFTYDNSNPGWTAVANTNNTVLTAGKPYLMYIRGSKDELLTVAPSIPPVSIPSTAATLSATGTLRTGDVEVSGLNATAGGYSLIGNPYQAQVDMAAIFSGVNATASNLSTSYYWVVDPSIGPSIRGKYVAVDLTDEAPTAHISKYLQPGQACFVQTSSEGGAASLTFKEVHKSFAAAQTSIFRTRNTAIARIKLTLSDVNANGLDVLKIAFDPSHSNAVDYNDASKMTNFDESMATSNSGKLLSIEKRAIPSETDEIPLNITKYRGTTYSIKAEGAGLTGPSPYLFDKYTSTTTEIPQDGSVNYAYTIDAAIPASIAADRFKLIYAKSLKTIDNELTGFALYPNPSQSNSFNVVVPQTKSKVSLSVSNLLGQQLYSQNDVQSGATAKVTVSNVKTAGIYLVSVTAAGKTATTKWIVE